MAIGDIVFSTYNVDTDIYRETNTVQHLFVEFPVADWLILGTGINPAKGTGGKGKTRIIIFAMART